MCCSSNLIHSSVMSILLLHPPASSLVCSALIDASQKGMLLYDYRSQPALHMSDLYRGILAS